jgi:hypothetical protein
MRRDIYDGVFNFGAVPFSRKTFIRATLSKTTINRMTFIRMTLRRVGQIYNCFNKPTINLLLP